VAVLLKVYANCIDDQEQQVNARIEAALTTAASCAKLARPSNSTEVNGKVAGQARDGSAVETRPEEVSAARRAGRVADGDGLENR
jgi:hypothetical protein